MSYNTFLQLLALIVLICTIQFVMLLLWYPHIDTPVNDKVTKFTSSTLREVRKLIRRRPEEDTVDEIALNNRVAVLVPYLGDKLPAWFDAFMLTASSSADLFDWFIFISDAPLIPTPPNVKLIQISNEIMYNRLARLDTKRYVNDAEFMTLAIQRLIEHHPYVLVEFKPCLGFLFQDYIESYSHWAFADLDTLVGRVPAQLTQQHLNSFDIVSYSFGDNYRLYLRGQLTIVRNTPLTNSLWKECHHLSSLGTRLDSFVHSSEAISQDSNQKNHGWRFQSAEGCFSRVAMDSKNVSIIYLSSQLSDAFTAPRGQKESLLLGHSVVRCHQEGINLSRDYDKLHAMLTSQISNPSSSSSAGASGSVSNLLKTISKKQTKSAGQFELQMIQTPSVNIPLKRLHDIRCSYWIEPSFDVCVEELPSSANVVKRVDTATGRIQLSYHTVAQYELFTDAEGEGRQEGGGSTCREASIVHFQGWKHNYGSFVSRPPSGDAQVMLITEVGLVPLRIAPPPPVTEGVASGYNSTELLIPQPSLPSFSDLYDSSILFAGRLIPSDALLPPVTPVKDSKQAVGKNLRSRVVKAGEEEMTQMLQQQDDQQSEGRDLGGDNQFISRLTAQSSSLATRYCGGYSTNLQACSCHIQSGDIEVLQRPGKRATKSRTAAAAASEVTMVLVAWDFDLYDRSLDLLLTTWDGPKVLVLGKTKESSPSGVPSVARKADTTILLVDLGGKRCLSYLNQDASPPHYILPDNMLFNVALDVVPTDLVLLVPALMHSSRRVSLRSWRGSSVGLAVQLRQKLHQLQASLGTPEITKVFTYSNSPALVIPMYVVVDEEPVSDVVESEQQERSAAAVPSLHKYPLSNSWCGESQPASLQMSFELVVGETNTDPMPIPFDSKELLKERTLMLPVLFNMTAGPHGRDFLRLPEELSGHGCYGATLLRVLAGSGYSLYWATGGEYLSVGNKARESTPDGDFLLNEIACGCAYGNDANAQRDLTNRLNSYYLRAVELRAKGIGSVFTGEPFGQQFEKNTMKQT